MIGILRKKQLPVRADRPSSTDGGGWLWTDWPSPEERITTMTKKPANKRIYRYYNDILVDVIDDSYLYKLDENKAKNIIDELEKNGTYRQGEILYSLKSINSDTNTTNIYNA